MAGYPSVSASCEIPDRLWGSRRWIPRLSSMEYNEYYYDLFRRILQLDLTLNDPPGVDNYYLLNLEAEPVLHGMEGYHRYQLIDSLYDNGEWNYSKADSSYTITDIFRYVEQCPYQLSTILWWRPSPTSGILFSDQLIDGKKYSFRGIYHSGIGPARPIHAVVDIQPSFHFGILLQVPEITSETLRNQGELPGGSGHCLHQCGKRDWIFRGIFHGCIYNHYLYSRVSMMNTGTTKYYILNDCF